LHSKLDPGSLDEKPKLADAKRVGPDGPDAIDVSGATVSTVHESVPGEGSTFPTASTARTAKLWDPSETAATACGEEHADQTPSSSLHSKLDPASLDVNTKLAEPEGVGPDGPDAITVSGGSVSGTRARYP
jgi:hypothetical protein